MCHSRATLLFPSHAHHCRRPRPRHDRPAAQRGRLGDQSRDEVNISAARGVAIREFPLKIGYGEADYLLYVDNVPSGVVEAKKEGATLTGYEIQTEKYSVGLPPELKPARKPLPFCYQSTGIESRFTNLIDPDARSRPVFSFHRPETLAEWLAHEAKAPGSQSSRPPQTSPQ